MTTRVSVTATPVAATTEREWVWDLVAEDGLSGDRHDLRSVECDPADVTRRVRDIVARERPDFVILSIIVESTPKSGPITARQQKERTS